MLRHALPLLASLTALACGAGEGAPRERPEGTVLIVEMAGDEESITAAEVDRWNETVALLEAGITRPAQRRYSLTNVALHRAVARLIDPAARVEARRNAEAARKRCMTEAPIELEATSETLASLELTRLLGGFSEVGLQAWGMAAGMQAGEWSPLYESAGAFHFFRLVQRPPADLPWSAASGVTVWRATYPYLIDVNPRAIIEEALDQSRLTILDPAWEEIVPQHYVYRMQ